MIIVLWRAGLRIGEALPLAESELDRAEVPCRCVADRAESAARCPDDSG